LYSDRQQEHTNFR